MLMPHTHGQIILPRRALGKPVLSHRFSRDIMRLPKIVSRHRCLTAALLLGVGLALTGCQTVSYYAQAVRGHWGIENCLHWVLDVTFDEDQSRTRNRHMADNLSWLRRFAISLLNRHPSNHSIKPIFNTSSSYLSFPA